MPGSWSYGTEWRVLGICSSLLHLNLILSTFTLLCSPGQETQSFLHSWSAAQMVGGLLGLKEKSGLELCWEVFEPQDCRKTSVQQHGAATVHSSQDAKKIKRGLVVWFGFFFLFPGQYYSEHILLTDIMDIMELQPHFLFQPQLSVGGELSSQVVCSWNPSRQGIICDQIAQNRATTHLLVLEGRSRYGKQSGSLFRTEMCLLWHGWHTVGGVFTIYTCPDISLCECTQQVQNQIKSTVLFSRHLVLRGGTWLLCWQVLWKC